MNDLVPTVQWKQKDLIVYLDNPRDRLWRDELNQHRQLEILYRSTIDIAKFYNEFKDVRDLKWDFFAKLDELVLNVTRKDYKNKMHEIEIRIPFLRIKESFISYLIQSKIKVLPRVSKYNILVGRARLQVRSDLNLPKYLLIKKSSSQSVAAWFNVRSNRKLLRDNKKVLIPDIDIKEIPEDGLIVVSNSQFFIKLDYYFYYTGGNKYTVLFGKFYSKQVREFDVLPEFIDALKACFNDISSAEENATFEDYISKWAKELLSGSQFYHTKLLNDELEKKRTRGEIGRD